MGDSISCWGGLCLWAIVPVFLCASICGCEQNPSQPKNSGNGAANKKKAAPKVELTDEQKRQKVAELIEQLKDEEVGRRMQAADGLGDLGAAAKSAVPALIGALNDEDILVRRDASYALGSIGPDALPALIEALKSPHENVRRGSVHALGRMGPAARDALPALTEARNDEGIRMVSDDAIKKIKGSD